MSESKQIKLCVDTEYPPTCEGFTAIVDEKTRGLLFYEEVSDKERAERFVKCWNSHKALLAALEFIQTALANWRDGKDTTKHPVHGDLHLEEVKYCVVDIAIAEAKKGA